MIANGRRAGVPKAFDKAWIGVLQNDLGAWKHAEFGLGTALTQAQRYGYTQMINNAASSIPYASPPRPSRTPPRSPP